ncbi:3-hydroxyacyl-CoA dehydrogenase NAD-binding domain-containing protein [Rhodoferax sp.]|uniref:3-hydroxyacyl-CoA dehydrogenase NAD-binding domain-containing protein n=1 Tax=Rhodoferax sp. TaxID=50421 RepID=UPI0025DD02F5|nr:3-hydroxyacyl-CoA dehydrogenase NAD-binding domain-containing protein [Rhodoferax sp.]MCM2339710.1 3-hydroxyacyl-CoA dehydrogenase NAD-binding domain-containing protein [Rhodoferax sp.]
MLSIQNDVAVIAINNPPVNSLGHALREKIVQEIQMAQSDPAVLGIVLVGNDKLFSAGSDVTEFGTDLQFREPILRTVISTVEDCQKPVVAAIAGIALGGGLELALACHGRVALASARIGFPEVNLGLIPGSGGTQRLPRLVGPEAALTIILSGQPVAVTDHKCLGLFSAIVEDDVIPVAVQRVLDLVNSKASLPNVRDIDLDPAQVRESVDKQRSKLNGRQRLQPAYGAALDAVMATTQKLEAGLQIERALFLDLVSSKSAQALRYLFKVEREASRLPPDLHASPRQVQQLAVIGAGTMGSGIAIAALDADLSVLLLEQDENALERGRQRIKTHYRERVQSGKINEFQAATNESRLTTTTDWSRLVEADLVIEAVFEDLQVKREVFGKIDVHARQGAVLATNTSYLDIDAIAEVTQRPQDVIGLHFFSPANVMKLLEVVRGDKTSADVLATAMVLGTRLKKTPVLCGNAFGFIGNRIYNAYRRQCEFMLEDGAWPEEVDSALTAMGFAMGPFAVADLSGLDIAWRMRKAQAATRDPGERYVSILDKLCEQGRLGRKTGAGYYVYTDDKKATVTDQTVRNLIDQASVERGIERRSLSAEEIQRRALLAMVNEAALLLSEGVATRAEDIDVVLTQGYGFPRWEGGPVFWARHQEKHRLEAELSQLAREAGHGFALGNLEILL